MQFYVFFNALILDWCSVSSLKVKNKHYWEGKMISESELQHIIIFEDNFARLILTVSLFLSDNTNYSPHSPKCWKMCLHMCAGKESKS